MKLIITIDDDQRFADPKTPWALTMTATDVQGQTHALRAPLSAASKGQSIAEMLEALAEGWPLVSEAAPQCRDALPQLVILDLEIENSYADETVHTNYRECLVVAPTRAQMQNLGNDTGDPEQTLQMWAEDQLFPFTGTDRGGDALYTVTISSASIPELVNQTFTFGE